MCITINDGGDTGEKRRVAMGQQSATEAKLLGCEYGERGRSKARHERKTPKACGCKRASTTHFWPVIPPSFTDIFKDAPLLTHVVLEDVSA